MSLQVGAYYFVEHLEGASVDAACSGNAVPERMVGQPLKELK